MMAARRLLIPPLVVAILFSGGVVGAQGWKKKKPKEEPPPAVTAPPAPPEPNPEEVKREQARSHFDRGLSLFEEEAWDAALVEFTRSHELYPTRAATKNAAICLRRLHRFDEALDMFDTLLREFPNLPAADKAVVEREVTELRARVGSVDVRMTEPGATIVIDGRERGASPLTAPLRVSVGSHVVRVFKRGYAPFEKHVNVSGGQFVPVDVKLEALTQSGTLKVSLKDGGAVDVLVDNVVVGKTPWEGPLPAGLHTVVLRGHGVVGTQPTAANIRLDKETSLELTLVPLESTLRIEPVPAQAAVSIDGVMAGHGVWDGRLRFGSHRIEVSAEGYLTARREITLKKGASQKLAIELERDPNSPLWRTEQPSGVFLELDGGGLTSLGFRGDLECSGACTRPVDVGGLGMARIGYGLSRVVGLSLDVGYLVLREKLADREAKLVPVGREANEGRAFDVLWLRALLVGASVGARTKGRWPVTFRAGGGALLGSVRDTRSGRFTTSPASGSVLYEADPAEETVTARYAYAAPELRVGRRLGRSSELSFGVVGLLLFEIDLPKWKDEKPVLTGNCGASPTPGCVTDGDAVYGKQALMGSFVALISPQLGFRYDF